MRITDNVNIAVAYDSNDLTIYKIDSIENVEAFICYFKNRCNKFHATDLIENLRVAVIPNDPKLLNNETYLKEYLSK